MTGYRRMFGYFGGLALLLTLNLAVVTPAKSQITQVTGKVTLKQADGTVTVNGSPAIAGATILSGATVTTAKGSSAVVSLGKLGRVEVAAETTVKLVFTDLAVGVAMVDSPNGRATIVTTPASGGNAPTSGELTAVGEVSVNGTNAISGATVFSDSTVTTARGSSAVVSLGKLGRVEVMEGSRMNLKFDGTGITAMLSQGRVRVSSGG